MFAVAVDYGPLVQDRLEDRRFIEVTLDGGDSLVWARGPVESTTDAVVLLHDRAMNGRAWDLVMRRLPAGMALLAPDLRGRGSAWRLPPSSGVDRHLLDLDHILDQLDIDHVVVVGHGFGAVVGREFHRRAPERVVMAVGVRGSGPDPFHSVLGVGFRDRLEHRRYWERHPALAAVADQEGVREFLDHGIAGPEDHHRWRVDLRSLIADDASVDEIADHDSGRGYTRSIVVGSPPEPLATGPSGWIAHLPDADPAIVVLTRSGADAVAAQIRPLLRP